MQSIQKQKARPDANTTQKNSKEPLNALHHKLASVLDDLQLGINNKRKMRQLTKN